MEQVQQTHEDTHAKRRRRQDVWFKTPVPNTELAVSKSSAVPTLAPTR